MICKQLHSQVYHLLLWLVTLVACLSLIFMHKLSQWILLVILRQVHHTPTVLKAQLLSLNLELENLIWMGSLLLKLLLWLPLLFHRFMQDLEEDLWISSMSTMQPNKSQLQLRFQLQVQPLQIIKLMEMEVSWKFHVAQCWCQ